MPKMARKDLLSTERIYQLVQRHTDLAQLFFDDFAKIALGEVEPRFNMEISKVSSFSEIHRCRVYKNYLVCMYAYNTSYNMI